MNVRQLYTKIDIHLQEINSNVYGNVLPEEKDIVVNEQVLEFIRDREDNKSNVKRTDFQQTTQYYDDIKELLNIKSLPVYKYTDNSSLAILPPDYLRFVEASADLKCELITGDTATSTVSKQVYELEIPDDSSSKNYEGFILQINSVDVVEFNKTKYPAYSNGFQNEEKFLLIDLVYDELIDKGFNVYREWYNGKYYSNKLILVLDSVQPVNIRVNDTPTDVPITATQVDFTKYDIAADREDIECRLISTADISNVLNSSFRTTSYKSPILELSKDIVIVHHQKKFIPTSLELRYICRPRKISLNLNKNVNLNSNVMGIIAKRTAERLAVIKSNANAQLITQHNNLIE
jgi:hypothetical protein